MAGTKSTLTDKDFYGPYDAQKMGESSSSSGSGLVCAPSSTLLLLLPATPLLPCHPLPRLPLVPVYVRSQGTCG